MNTIIEMIAEWFISLFFPSLFRVLSWTGALGMKILTFSRRPVRELEERYKDSVLPYFLGIPLVVGLVAGVVLLIQEVVY